jgi:uncharacterized membrane protein HdeD (DUF308 family)
MTERWQEQTAGAGVPSSGADPWRRAPVFTVPELARVRKWLLVAGVLALIAGVVSIAVPIIASVAIALFIGWVLVFAGVTMTIHAISDRAVVRGLQGLVTLVVGLYIIIFPLNGTVSLTFALAVWFFASGIMHLLHAWQWPGAPEAWLSALGGALSIVLGFLIAAGLPSSASWAIGLLVGINLIFWGIRAIVAAQAMKQAWQP